MVVATHALGYARLPEDSAHLIAGLVQPIAVPAFFFVDGFLFGAKNAQNQHLDYWSYVKKSAGRLLIPWLIFSLAYAAMRGLAEYTGYLPTAVVYGQSPGTVLLSIYASSISEQMYFLLSLFMIRMCSPVMLPMAQAQAPARIACFVLYSLFFHGIDLRPLFLPGLDPLFHALWGIQFYLLGIALSARGILPVRHLPLSVLLAMLLGSVTGLMPGIPAPISQFVLLVGSYLLFLSGNRFLSRMEGIGRHSMGIFLLHIPLVMKVFSLALPVLLVPSSFWFFVVLTLATALASLFLSKGIVALPCGAVLFGERSPNKT